MSTVVAKNYYYPVELWRIIKSYVGIYDIPIDWDSIMDPMKNPYEDDELFVGESYFEKPSKTPEERRKNVLKLMKKHGDPRAVIKSWVAKTYDLKLWKVYNLLDGWEEQYVRLVQFYKKYPNKNYKERDLNNAVGRIPSERRQYLLENVLPILEKEELFYLECINKIKK